MRRRVATMATLGAFALGAACESQAPPPFGDDATVARDTVATTRDTVSATRDSAAGTSADTTTAPDTTGGAFDPLWDPEHIPTFRLQLAVDDWEATLWSLLPESACERRPYAVATLVFENPQTGTEERLEQVGMRWRGRSSLNITEPQWQRPGIKLSFDELEPGRRFHDAKKLNFMGTEGDYSLMHEALAFGVARALGLATPELTYAHVWVDGAYLGVYPMVEEGDDDPFLERHWNGDDQGELFEVDGYCGGAGRFDEHDTPEALAETYAPKAHTEVADIGEVVLPIVACLEIADDAAMSDCLAPLVDLDALRRIVALDAAVGNPDGMHGAGQNYTFYRPTRTGKVVFNPWDMDLAFSPHLLAAPDDAFDTRPTWKSTAPLNRLSERVLAADPAAYCDVLADALALTDPAVLLPQVDALRRFLKPLMTADPFMDEVAWGDNALALEDAIEARYAAMSAAVAACPGTR